MIKKAVTFPFSAVLLLILSSLVTSAKEPGSLLLPNRIYLGGVNGFDALQNEHNTRMLRASNRVGLYVHMYIWDRIGLSEKIAVTKVFEGASPAAVEGNESSHPETYWSKLSKSLSDANLVISKAHINTKSPTTSALTPSEWNSFVDVGRQHKFELISPIFTPNDRSWMEAPFADPRWDEAKRRALRGGGITIDSPPWYFLSHPREYQAFVEDEIKWAHSAGIVATLIISPPRDNIGDFFHQTEVMLRILNGNGAAPSEIIFENYMSSPPQNFRFVIGAEDNSDSVSGVALKILNISK